jgi:serine/threonine protein kinase
MAQMTGWDAGPLLTSSESSPYSAPELFLSPESVIMEHRKADVWSLGMLFVEAARGKPLVKTDPNRPLEPHVAIAGMMVSLGTPCETALRALDPNTPTYPALRRIVRKPWRHVLKESALKVDRMHWQLLDAMLDWNPETRESAVSLLCFPYFSASHSDTDSHSSATPLTLTDSELRGIISLAFTAHASHVGADSAEAESPCALLQSPTGDRPASKRGLHSDIRLGPIREDSFGERDSSPSSSSSPSNLAASQAHSAAAPRSHRAAGASRCCSTRLGKEAASAALES